MWPPLLNHKISTSQKLREYAEEQGRYLASVYQTTAQSNVKEEVELLLKEKQGGWLEKIEGLLQKEENQAVIHQDEEVKLLQWLCLCNKKEKQEGRISLLYQCDSLKTISEIYQVTIFYLTRLELDMEKKVCMDFLELINGWNLSPEYVVMILEKGKLGDRIHAGKRLVQLLQEQGNLIYAEQILKEIRKLWGNVA